MITPGDGVDDAQVDKAYRVLRTLQVARVVVIVIAIGLGAAVVCTVLAVTGNGGGEVAHV